jgi:selT/selW/selH-like putative selenoprotein
VKDIEMRRLSGGIFDVYVNGKMVFSRHQTGGFPQTAEIEAMVKAG